ncbi:DUF2505 family protein [Brevibacterium jeotgali]|uniref:Carbon monoxide dehydrogenase subunit G n=1 Tax=Brevibacterium jeotgali TaxID=1262550 RepID=A0A2H1L634_9MICO|nr:DUF2505 family protein [Brevibacterium jeotgali]TWC03545.1 uncharacterized protein DUF2505 [Brevibacterium jeotgali]SMY12367.1 Protein of unknown function (DUF2505) [Brevibacterium jeotgali]
MKSFTLTGASALSPARLRTGLLDPTTWRGQDGVIESTADDALTVSFPLGTQSVPDSLSRFVPADAVLRMEVHTAAEAPVGSPQTAGLRVTVPGAPVMVRVELIAHPTAPAADPADAAEGVGSTLRAHTEIESSVPLFGPVVESALEPVVRSQLTEKFDELADLG